MTTEDQPSGQSGRASDAGGPVHLVKRACNLCEAICGLELSVNTTAAGAEVVAIRGDGQDPFSRGHICPKALGLMDLQTDPDRLRSPVRRVGERFEPISWDDALELVATRLAEVRAAHGADAIATYQGNPSVHSLGLMTHAGAFLGLLKTRNRFSATSVDQLPHQLVVSWMYGHPLLVPIPDIDHTQFFLMLGANPLASNGSLMTVPDVEKRLKALLARGGQLVVIDPRRTETAKLASKHHFIRPGTDAALLLSLIHFILKEGLDRPGRLAEMLSPGWDEARALLQAATAEYTPERAQALTGIEAAAIAELARAFAKAPSAVCYGRMGCSTQAHGTLCQWAIQVLNLITGNLDAVGGSLATTPALDVLASTGTKGGSYGRFHSRVSGRPEALGELPVAVMAEEMLTPGEGQVRALVCVAGNPVLSTPNGRQLEKALAGLDFMVSMDLYINETNRFADVILPTTTPLEREHFDMIFNLFAVHNVARYSPPALPKPEGAMHDWELMNALGERLAAKLGLEPKRLPTPTQMLDFGLRAGPWGHASEVGLTLPALQAQPSGVLLGPLQPSFPQRLFTPGHTIRLWPEPIHQALAHAAAQWGPAAGPATGPATGGRNHPRSDAGGTDDGSPELLLIGRRDVRSNNSWMHNSQRLTKGPVRHALLMHADDLAARGLSDGQAVRVRSRVGEVQVQVQASADLRRGTVCLPHGWGHQREVPGRPPVGWAQAAQTRGVSANDLTDDAFIDPISGVAALNGVPVRVFATAQA
jgi:anaerobic selenocysteine-containing dehydrogenase